MYYRDAHTAILVYDITDRESWNGLTRWYEEIRANWPDKIVIAVAANKSDLEDLEAVDSTTAMGFAEEKDAVFASTSAKDNTGIE